jgi:hypothetical protein
MRAPDGAAVERRRRKRTGARLQRGIEREQLCGGLIGSPVSIALMMDSIGRTFAKRSTHDPVVGARHGCEVCLPLELRPRRRSEI